MSDMRVTLYRVFSLVMMAVAMVVAAPTAFAQVNEPDADSAQQPVKEWVKLTPEEYIYMWRETAVDNMEVYEESTPAEESDDAAEDVAERPAISRLLRTTLVLGGFLLGAVTWWFALTSLINIFRRGFRPRHMLTINHIAGIVISILGLYTLISVLIS